MPLTPSPSRPPWVLAVLLTGQLMAILDVSIVNVATPTIRLDLHASGAALQLIVAGYTIAYAVLLITGARLGRCSGSGGRSSPVSPCSPRPPCCAAWRRVASC